MTNHFGLESAQSVQALALRMTSTPEERDWWSDYLANHPEEGVFPPELTLEDTLEGLDLG